MKTNECTNLIIRTDSITIPEGTEEIGMSAFADCTNLKEVKLPSTLREIGACAFSNCKNLKEVKLPSTLRRIGMQAFAGSGIEHLVIPEGVERITDCVL